jgi:hypothetical protein
MNGRLLREFPRPPAVRDIHCFTAKFHGRLLRSADIVEIRDNRTGTTKTFFIQAVPLDFRFGLVAPFAAEPNAKFACGSRCNARFKPR